VCVALTLSQVSRCVVGPTGAPCVTIMYAPGDSEWVAQLMRALAIQEGLDPDKDLKPFGTYKNGGLLGFGHDYIVLANYTRDHPNTTHLIVQFQSGYSDPQQLPADPGYTVWYNNSRTASDTNDVQPFLRALDEQIARMQTGNPNITMHVQTADYPLPESRFSQLDIVSANGGVYFYLVPMIVFFVLLSGIVQEKEANLRTGMRMMGLSSAVYWLTWTMQGIFFGVVSTLALMAAGAACQFEVFLLTNQFVLFITFFFFTMAIVAVACCISAFISKLQTAQAVGYGIILLGFIFQSILTSNYGTFLEILFSDGVPDWVVFLRWIFVQYPPTNFAKIYSDIASLSGSSINAQAGTVDLGRGFAWNDLFNYTRTVYLSKDVKFTGPPPWQALALLLFNTAAWGIVAWYFNNVLGEGALPWYFPFTARYWGIDQYQARLAVQEAGREAGVVDAGLGLESAGESLAHEGALVRVARLSKTYRTLDCCVRKTNVAVEDVSFEIRRGEIFGLLGHNGAGKSTTINCLTGLVEPSGGEMEIAGLAVGENLAQVRRLLGVCPQHDILFDSLTAMEHLLLFAQIKGMTRAEAAEEAAQKLSLVGLLDVADHRVSTFSGGMKRRLSVSISAIGDPVLMLLDEPSTGMDPVNQKQMWKLIQDLKKDRAILLTTHSMREAEVLADRLCVIAFGRICAAGTAVELKHKFGLSYNVHIQTRRQAVEQVTTLVHEFVPDAPLVEQQDGALVFRVAPGSTAAVAPLLGRLQQLRETNVVEEYGITETSLEDVFLGVTREAGFRYESIGGHGEEVDEFLREGEQAGAKSSPLLPADNGLQPDAPKPPHKTRPRPFAALMQKNALLQGRQWGTNLCQVITPLLVLMILVILKYVAISQLGPQIDQNVYQPPIPFLLNASPEMWDLLYFWLGRLGAMSDPLPQENFQLRRDLMGGQRADKYLAQRLLGFRPPLSAHAEPPKPAVDRKTGRKFATNEQCLLFFLYAAEGGPGATPSLGSLGPNWQNEHAGGSGLLGRLPQHSCLMWNNTRVHVPYYLPRSTYRAMQDEVFADFNALNK
jgi:ABC-type multidrug transport system ATPase subunit